MAGVRHPLDSALSGLSLPGIACGQILDSLQKLYNKNTPEIKGVLWGSFGIFAREITYEMIR
jgi:hypothetical protein